MVGEVFTQQKLTARFSQVLDKARRRNKEFAQEFIKEFAKEIVRRSPEDTGQFKGSWYISINTRGFEGEPKLEPAGGMGTISPATIARFEATVDGYDGTQRLSFRNVAPYAYRLEFGFSGTDSLGREYDFQPAYKGFVRGTINNASIIANEVAERLRSQV